MLAGWLGLGEGVEDAGGLQHGLDDAVSVGDGEGASAADGGVVGVDESDDAAGVEQGQRPEVDFEAACGGDAQQSVRGLADLVGDADVDLARERETDPWAVPVDGVRERHCYPAFVCGRASAHAPTGVPSGWAPGSAARGGRWWLLRIVLTTVRQRSGWWTLIWADRARCAFGRRRADDVARGTPWRRGSGARRRSARSCVSRPTDAETLVFPVGGLRWHVTRTDVDRLCRPFPGLRRRRLRPWPLLPTYQECPVRGHLGAAGHVVDPPGLREQVGAADHHLARHA